MTDIIITKSTLGNKIRPLEYLKNIDFNLGAYSLEQVSHLFSGEFRGQIEYENSEYYKKTPPQIPYKKEVLTRGTRYIISETAFINWWNNVLNNTVEIDINDYVFTLKFALSNYIKNHHSGIGMAGQARDLNQKLSNDIAGKLAEIAFIKYAHRNFNTHLMADFKLWDGSVQENDYQYDIRKINNVDVNPNFAIEIKSTKLKSSIQDVRNSENFSCLVQVKLSLPEMHLLYFLDALEVLDKCANEYYCKNNDLLKSDYYDCETTYNKYLSKFFEWKNIPAYISGLKYRDELILIKDGILPCVGANVTNRLFTFSTLLDNSPESFKVLFKKACS